MVVDWQVAKSDRVCAATGRALEEGEVYFSALREEGESFLRADYAVDVWPAVDKTAFFSFWRTRVPAATEKKRLIIDTEAFYAFFSSLEDPSERHRQVFRYLVALILTRKRVLRLDSIDKTPEGDVLVLFDRRAEKEARVFCPEVSEEQLAEAQENLNQIFECQGGFEDEDEAD